MQETVTNEIGSVLRNRRQQMGLSLEQVAERTKIRKTHLHALEEENFDELPGKVYVVGFLQNYARFLEMPAEPLLHVLEERGYGKTKKEKHLHSAELMTAARVPARKSPWRFLAWLILLLLMLAASGFYYFPSFLAGNRVPEDSLPPDSSLSQAGGVQESAEQSVAGPAAGQADAEPVADPATAARLAALPEAMPVIPEEGATLKLLVEGEGSFAIAIDGEQPREYQAKPGMSLSWFAREKAELALDINGSAQLSIGQQELTLSGQQALRLVSVKDQEAGQ